MPKSQIPIPQYTLLKSLRVSPLHAHTPAFRTAPHLMGSGRCGSIVPPGFNRCLFFALRTIVLRQFLWRRVIYSETLLGQALCFLGMIRGGKKGGILLRHHSTPNMAPMGIRATKAIRGRLWFGVGAAAALRAVAVAEAEELEGAEESEEAEAVAGGKRELAAVEDSDVSILAIGEPLGYLPQRRSLLPSNYAG